MNQLYKKDRFAALLIYLYMMRETDERTFISSRNLEKDLEKIYGKDNRPSHNVISEILKELEEKSADLDISIKKGNQRQGYCIDEKDFQQWELVIFAESIAENKSLSTEDKIWLISKLESYMGPSYYGMFDGLVQHVQIVGTDNVSSNYDDTLEEILYAINNQCSVSDKNLFTDTRNISPYKLYMDKGEICLLYGVFPNQEYTQLDKLFEEKYKTKVDKRPHLATCELCYLDLQLDEDNRYHPVEEIEGYAEGIDEVAFRDHPFQYANQIPKDEIVVEINPDKLTVAGRNPDEHLIEVLKEKFGRNVEIYHKGGKQYAHIYEYVSKVREWFTTGGNHFYKVISPDSLVKLIQNDLKLMSLTYLNDNMSCEEKEFIQTTITLDSLSVESKASRQKKK